MTLQPGTATFRIIREIGKGGLGVVDEIEITASNSSSLLIGTRLARKRLGPQWAQHPAARERFEREITTLCTLQHSNIITCQGQNIGGERFYCMPLCQRSFRDILEGSPSGFEWRSVARLGTTIANALNYAHSLGFIHRDLKPENLLVDKLNNVVIADWGVGYFIHNESVVLTKLTKNGGVGTAYYCSIEQWSGSQSDPRMDIYALGMTLAELVRGQQLANFVIGMGIQTDIVQPTTTGAIIFNALLRQMTMLLASQRTTSMEKVATVLQQAIAMAETPPGRAV